MRYYLITDNRDTLVGLRLAGIEGIMVKDSAAMKDAIINARQDPNIGILIVTERLASGCREFISDMKLKFSNPLIVEIPDRHGTTRSPDSITKYIRESIGIKI